MTDSKQLLAAACALTGDPVEAVLAHRLAGETLTVVIDRGIHGAPKFEYAVADLTPASAAKAEPEPQSEAPATPPVKRSTARRSKR